VRFSVLQLQPGRKARGGRCVKVTKANRRASRCRLLVTLGGSFTRPGVAGVNRFHFTGRLGGRKLRSGEYEILATPTAGGRAGRAAEAPFRVTS
jgi:hypothetical protein